MSPKVKVIPHPGRKPSGNTPLQEKLNASGLTHQDLADHTGIPQMQICRYANNRRPIGITSAREILLAFGQKLPTIDLFPDFWYPERVQKKAKKTVKAASKSKKRVSAP